VATSVRCGWLALQRDVARAGRPAEAAYVIVHERQQIPCLLSVSR